MQINTALILCAGFGKRLLPLTQSTPKPLLKIGQITLLERTIKLIENRIQNNPVFRDLKFFLNKNFSTKLRKKYAN